MKLAEKAKFHSGDKVKLLVSLNGVPSGTQTIVNGVYLSEVVAKPNKYTVTDTRIDINGVPEQWLELVQDNKSEDRQTQYTELLESKIELLSKTCELLHHDIGVKEYGRLIKTCSLDDYFDLALELLAKLEIK